MEKYSREDGRVAILYTASFGGGWYSWNTDKPEMLFDKDIVIALLNQDLLGVAEIAEKKYPNNYTGGYENLQIEWLYPGTIFQVNCFDGKESIEILGNINDHLVA